MRTLFEKFSDPLLKNLPGLGSKNGNRSMSIVFFEVDDARHFFLFSVGTS